MHTPIWSYGPSTTFIPRISPESSPILGIWLLIEGTDRLPWCRATKHCRPQGEPGQRSRSIGNEKPPACAGGSLDAWCAGL